MIYRVASNPGDYQSCHRLMDEEGVTRSRITFPTVIAMEKEKGGLVRLVGFIGTRIENKMIVAGPLVLRSDRRRIFTAIRLAEAYEMAMRNLGIKSFIFHGEAGGILEKAVKRYYPHAVPYAVRDGIMFWAWKIDGKQGISTRSVA